MHSFQVIRDVLQTTSAKQIAGDMGLSLSLIYKWAEKPDPEAATASHNPLDRMDQLLKSTRDLRLIHWLCQRAGGFFIRNPTTHHTHPEYLMPATNGVVQEFADLLAVIASAASDNRIDPAEAIKIRARWEELKRSTETFVACCEAGNFQALEKTCQQ